MLIPRDIYLNPCMFTIRTISGLLTKPHGGIKKCLMARDVVEAPSWMLLTIRSFYRQSLVVLGQ